MHRSRHLLVLALVALAVVLLLPTLAAAMTYDQAVTQLYDKGYPQNIETYLNNLGTSPLGFRLGGTSADDTAARYLAYKLRAAGYSNVKLEAVPVDEWAVRGASFTPFYGEGKRIVCSQFAGVPGTQGDLYGQVVYVGNGTAADYEGVDVRGKIVLVDSSMENFWLNFQGAEATKHGALAVILTSNYSQGTDMDFSSAPWYIVAPDALGANDGEYDRSFVPLVYMSQQDGDALKHEIATNGAVWGVLNSKVDVTMADDGGEGYNVVATLPGTQKNGRLVIWNAHHDAHFRAGLDDTGAVAATMAAAKAMKMSGYQPRTTIKFVFDTAEEFGYTDCWYDWSIGAWHLITQRHPDWAGKIAAMYSIELMAAKDAQVDINTSPELVAWLDKICADNPDLVPNGYAIETPQSTWQNGWSFMASGVPSFEISAGGPGYDDMYHSDYEDYDKVDWGLTRKMTMLFMRLNAFTDRDKQLPYDFAGRAADLREHFDADELEAAGLIGGPVTALDSAITRFGKTSTKFGASAAAITGARGPASRNATMLKVAKKVVKGMTAMDAWDVTCYPHEQTMWDGEYLLAAWHALDADPADTAAALEALTSVGINWNGVIFSPSVYRFDLTRHDPDYDRITWGKLGKLVTTFDLTPVMAEIQDGQIDQAMDEIYSMYSTNLYDLTKRVQNMTKTLNDASDLMQKAM